jgi:uncharacterized protein involved in response to NO
MISKIIAFIKSVLSERDGTGSASRVVGAVIVLAVISWVTYLVITTKALPDLTSASLFVAAGFSGYGVNKLAGAVRREEGQ